MKNNETSNPIALCPIFVIRGRKPGPPRTSDGGVPDVTPFLKASLLKFEVRLSHVVAFGGCFRLSSPGLRVEVGACIVKSNLLR
jgi:hypothetical protein